MDKTEALYEMIAGVILSNLEDRMSDALTDEARLTIAIREVEFAIQCARTILGNLQEWKQAEERAKVN